MSAPLYFTFGECMDGYWDNMDADHSDAGQRTAEYLCAVSSSPEPVVQVEVVNPPAYQPPAPASAGTDLVPAGIGLVVVMLAVVIGMQVQSWRHNR